MKILPLLLLAIQLAVQTHDDHSYETTIFLNPETSAFLGRPAEIQADEGSLYFYDAAFTQITNVDTTGEKQFAFGREGSGPGEFRGVSGFWVFEDRYMIYDYNSFRFNTYHKDGQPDEDITIDENPIDPDRWPPAFPVGTVAVQPHKVLVPSRGIDGSLFGLVNIITGSVELFGEAIGDYVADYDGSEVDAAHSSGNIPEVMVNLVALDGNESAIYSLQQTTGILQKFSHNGELLWEQDIRTSAQEGMFDQMAEQNKRNVEYPEKSPVTYRYALDIEVHEEGVAVLLKMFDDDHPVTVVWVPSDGSTPEKLTYTGIRYDEFPGLGQPFSISPEDATIYFLNFDDGEIRKAEWPL